MGRRCAALAGAFVLLAIAALLYVRTFSPGEDPPRAASLPSGASSPSLSGVASAQSAAPTLRSKPDAGEEAWKPDDLPAKVAQRHAEAADKRAFYDRAMKIGGGAYLIQAMAAWEQCQWVNQYGMVGAEQAVVARGIRDSPQYAERVAAFRAHIKGCEGFEIRRVDAQEHIRNFRRILDQPDLTSRAYSVRPDNLQTPEQQEAARSVALRALDSGDAYLLTELAQYFAHHRAGLLGSFRIASSADPRIDAMQRERDAWIWASCELGVECGPASANGRRVCFEMGKCDWRSIDDIAADVFSDAGKSPPRERKDEIVAAVRARDWGRLGF